MFSSNHALTNQINHRLADSLTCQSQPPASASTPKEPFTMKTLLAYCLLACIALAAQQIPAPTELRQAILHQEHMDHRRHR